MSEEKIKSLFKGTQGNWQYDEENQCITDDYGQIFICEFSNAPLGSQMEIDFDAEPYNARLIAAAPELLEALQGLIEWESYGNHVDEDVLNSAKAAITKALS